MAELPPARYRVVEEGRRLVVIDRWAEGARPDAPAPAPTGSLPSLLGAARQTRFDGGAELTTHPFYDANGPRTIKLDANSAGIVKAARLGAVAAAIGLTVLIALSPWLFVPAVFVLGSSRPRAALRERITAWLDTVAREAS